MGPAQGLDLSAKDVMIYVNGLGQAVDLGQGSRVRANVLAGNGSFTTGEGCVLEGSFIAKDITIGQKSIVKYDGAFSQGDGGAPPTPNSPPTAGFSTEVNGLRVNFTDASSDSDGSVVIWHWTFGDDDLSSVQNPEHTYPSSGDYTVTLTVTDNDGGSGTTTQEVSVSDGSQGGDIALNATGRKSGKKYYVDLTWSGTSTTNVDVYRDETWIATTYDDGSYTHSLGKTIRSALHILGL